MKRARIAQGALILCLAAGPVLGQEPPPEGTAAGVPEAIQVGREAPDFTLPAADGSSRTLTGLRGKKALVLVFFRGSW